MTYGFGDICIQSWETNEMEAAILISKWSWYNVTTAKLKTEKISFCLQALIYRKKLIETSLAAKSHKNNALYQILTVAIETNWDVDPS